MNPFFSTRFALTVLLLPSLLPLPTHAQSASDFTTTVADGKVTITTYTGSATVVVIPSKIGGLPVTALGNASFFLTKATKVTIPNGVTSLGAGVFHFAQSLTSVTIPSSVTSIGAESFNHCPSLRSVTLPDSVTSMGEGVFADSPNLITVTLPSGLTTIVTGLFTHDTSLASLILPEGVTTIEEGAFDGCTSLKSITFPPHVNSIQSSAFLGCTLLSSLTFQGDAPTQVGEFALDGASFMALYYYDGALGFVSPQWTDSSGESHYTIDLGPKPLPKITSAATASGAYKTAFTYKIRSSGSPATFQTAGLPAGLSLDKSTGVISGEPAVLGTFKVTLKATNPFGSGTASLTLSIAKATQKIVFHAIAEQFYGTPLILTATATSTLPVTYTITGPAKLSVDKLKFTGLGAVTVKASQAGSAHYLAAKDISESFPVKAGVQSITFPAIFSGQVGKTVTLKAAASSGLPITYSIVATAGDTGKATLSGAKLTFTKAGEIKLEADQSGNQFFKAAPPSRQNVEITGQ